MPEYILTNTEKVKIWKDIILGYLYFKAPKNVTAEEFVSHYSKAELSILQTCITELIQEGKVRQV